MAEITEKMVSRSNCLHASAIASFFRHAEDGTLGNSAIFSAVDQLGCYLQCCCIGCRVRGLA